MLGHQLVNLVLQDFHCLNAFETDWDNDAQFILVSISFYPILYEYMKKLWI